jgi:4'-phosphopantetheinyl transferase
VIEALVHDVGSGLLRAERSLLAWSLARRLVRDAAGIALDESATVVRRCARCGSTEHGKPELVVALAAGWHVSVSSTDGRVAAAVSDEGPVGVDVEAVAALARAPVAAVLLHPGERPVDKNGRVRSGDDRPGDDEAPGHTARSLAVLWVRKEAALKATGDGLALEPAGIRVSDPGDPPRVLAWPGGEIPDLRLRDLDTGPAHAACVAVLRV